MSSRDDEIKKAKIEWYSRKKCVQNYYSDRFVEPLGRIRDDVEKRIVLKNVYGKVLDAGCGPGRFALPIAKQKKGYYVIGIDTSSEMLKFARKTAKQERITNIEFIKGDIQFLPFKDNTFDSVVSVHVLFHLPQYAEILKEFIRVLKPHGRIIVDVDSGDHPDFLTKNLLIQTLATLIGKDKIKSNNITPQNPENPDLDFYAQIPLNECRNILEKAGAKLITKYTFDFPNSIWLTNSLFGSGKWINKLLSIKLIFKLFSFLEVYIFRYLPTSLSPRYFIIAEKEGGR